MTVRTNEFGQPIGPTVPGWKTAQLPQHRTLHGRYCSLAPLDPAAHGPDLFAAYSQAPDDRLWTYLRFGPFAQLSDYLAWAEDAAARTNPFTYAITDTSTGAAVGTMSLMRIDAANGSIEVGNVVFSPVMQGTAISTESQFLLMRHIFEDLGYRRYEWKCDDLNKPSAQAALRLGFTYEGTFRNAMVYKGRSRDTAWYSITDSEWRLLRPSFEAWLEPSNFTAAGTQKRSLAEFRTPPQ